MEGNGNESQLGTGMGGGLGKREGAENVGEKEGEGEQSIIQRICMRNKRGEKSKQSINLDLKMG